MTNHDDDDEQPDNCMCDWPSLCDGSGFLGCDGCGGDQCVCICICAIECPGCGECPGDETDLADDFYGPDDHDSEGA